MKPEVSFDKTVTTVKQGDLVHTMVEITAPPSPEMERSPIDVVFVIDRSGSMSGEPIVAVREAVAGVLRQMGPNDRAGVVAFDTDASMVLPLGRHDNKKSQQRVLQMSTGASTNMSAGWLMGHEMLRSDCGDDRIRRIVVLTDGYVNQGITGEDELATMVSIGRNSGITTSLIGFSTDYQEELLGTLANAGGGNDYWCESADPAARVFQREFEGLAAVVAQNIAITIEPTDVVAVAGILNDFRVTELDNGALRVDLGDAFGGETRSVVIGFHLRPHSAVGVVDVASLRMSWISTTEGFAAHNVTVPINVTAAEAGMVDSGADPRVQAEVTLLEAAKDRRESRRLANEGDFTESIKHAQKAVVKLQALPGHESALEQARQELNAMLDRSWDEQMSKQSFTSSREMSRKRLSQFRDDDE